MTQELKASPTIKTRVWRSVGAEAEGHFETFEVPTHDNQTVLDVVSAIQQTIDPTLSYRFACRVGMCGSCAMMVNGTPRWTCRTHVNKVVKDGQLTVAPLRNLPVIKDLAVDMDSFFEKWVKAGGTFRPSQTRLDPISPVKPDAPERVAASKGIECINCSVCYAACDTVSKDPAYLGPAALQRAWTIYNDARQEDRKAILQTVSGTGGCHSCHSQGSCTLHCPNELDPMSAIAGLKRESVRSLFRKGKAQ